MLWGGWSSLFGMVGAMAATPKKTNVYMAVHSFLAKVIMSVALIWISGRLQCQKWAVHLLLWSRHVDQPDLQVLSRWSPIDWVAFHDFVIVIVDQAANGDYPSCPATQQLGVLAWRQATDGHITSETSCCGIRHRPRDIWISWTVYPVVRWQDGSCHWGGSQIILQVMWKKTQNPNVRSSINQLEPYPKGKSIISICLQWMFRYLGEISHGEPPKRMLFGGGRLKFGILRPKIFLKAKGRISIA